MMKNYRFQLKKLETMKKDDIEYNTYEGIANIENEKFHISISGSEKGLSGIIYTEKTREVKFGFVISNENTEDVINEMKSTMDKIQDVESSQNDLTEQAHIPEDFNVSSAVIFKENIHRKTEDDLSVIKPIIEYFNALNFQFVDGPPYRDKYYTFGFYNTNNEFIKINIVSEDVAIWESSTRIKDTDTKTDHFKYQYGHYQLVDDKFDFSELDMYFQSFSNFLK